MDKSELVRKISTQYGTLGISYQQDATADIIVDQELLDVKFAAGKANIHYQNSVLIREEDQTVYFWEDGAEQKKGVLLIPRSKTRILILKQNNNKYPRPEYRGSCA